ncbi:hypothetical protein ACQ4LE_001674 [Meloidogyne hapla]|uniref:HTH_Tnp_Tc3_1 domain-containing protein n=1 Tax=Meloidogyne hapla TaxID=6305 RepID=A0A1I8BEZ0_MELHA
MLDKETEDKIKSYYNKNFSIHEVSILCGVSCIHVMHIWSIMKNKSLIKEKEEPRFVGPTAKIQEFMVERAKKNKMRNQALGYNNIFKSEYDKILEKYGFVTKKKTTKYDDHLHLM